MPKESVLNIVTTVDNTDYVRVVTNPGESKLISVADIGTVVTERAYGAMDLLAPEPYVVTSGVPKLINNLDEGVSSSNIELDGPNGSITVNQTGTYEVVCAGSVFASIGMNIVMNIYIDSVLNASLEWNVTLQNANDFGVGITSDFGTINSGEVLEAFIETTSDGTVTFEAFNFNLKRID